MRAYLVQHGEAKTEAEDPAAPRADAEVAREPRMVVRRLPHVSRLGLSPMVEKPGREVIGFRNGAIICLARADCRWPVQWVTTPELAESPSAA